MNLSDGIKRPAAACYVVWRPRASGVDQRRGLQPTSAPSSFGAVLKAADMTSVQLGSARCGIAQPRLTLTGQRSYTDERERPSKRFGLMQGSRRATSISGGHRMVCRKIGNPCAEKVRPHRARQNNVSEPALVAGVGGHWQGTLTITGSNVRLGTEMPVALSSFSQ
jgi:hypothetical protein